MKLTAGPVALNKISDILRGLVITQGPPAQEVVTQLGVYRPGHEPVVVQPFVLDRTVSVIIRRQGSQMQFYFGFEWSTEKDQVLYRYMAHMAAVLAVALGLEREVDFDDGRSMPTREQAIALAKRLHDLASGRVPK